MTFAGKGLVEWLLLIPIIVPSVVATMGIHIAFIRLRVADTYLGVVLIHLIPCIPYMILVMTSVFANYGTALEDTARTLGASAVRTFWYVTLPAIWPGLLVATLFTFLISWSQYVTTLLIGGGRVITLPMILFPFISGSNNCNRGGHQPGFCGARDPGLGLHLPVVVQGVVGDGRLWADVDAW